MGYGLGFMVLWFWGLWFYGFLNFRVYGLWFRSFWVRVPSLIVDGFGTSGFEVPGCLIWVLSGYDF